MPTLMISLWLPPQLKQGFRLSILLDTLGLPMIPSRKTPPCETHADLGTEVNILEGTLGIAPDKLHSIYQIVVTQLPKSHYLKSSTNL